MMIEKLQQGINNTRTECLLLDTISNISSTYLEYLFPTKMIYFRIIKSKGKSFISHLNLLCQYSKNQLSKTSIYYMYKTLIFIHENNKIEFRKESIFILFNLISKSKGFPTNEDEYLFIQAIIKNINIDNFIDEYILFIFGYLIKYEDMKILVNVDFVINSIFKENLAIISSSIWSFVNICKYSSSSILERNAVDIMNRLLNPSDSLIFIRKENFFFAAMHLASILLIDDIFHLMLFRSFDLFFSFLPSCSLDIQILTFDFLLRLFSFLPSCSHENKYSLNVQLENISAALYQIQENPLSDQISLRLIDLISQLNIHLRT
jgi:hypothetical protein